jgi:hypothetical protein
MDQMAENLQERSSTGIGSIELRQLLGAAPVLRTENARSYDEIMGRLMQCLAPRDFMEQMLIKELTDCTWEMARYVRHKTLSMECGLREHLKFPGQDALAERLADQSREPGGGHDGLVDEAGAIAVELDHARALEATLGFHERVDKLLVTATASRDNVLEQIARYRDGLDYRLRQISDSIIDAGFEAAGRTPGPLAAALVSSDTKQQ